MPAKTGERKAGLRERLITAAKARIAAGGLAAVKARDLAADAGCALGALYTVFTDVDALVLEVSALTLARIDEAMEAAVAGEPDPGRRLVKLGKAYLNFAVSNARLWRALFEHTLPEDQPLPGRHTALLGKLLAHIADPVSALQPGLAPEALMTRTRTLFAAVHGIISISLDRRYVGLPQGDLEDEVERFVGLLLVGLRNETWR